MFARSVRLGLLACLAVAVPAAKADFIAPTLGTYGWDRPTTAGGTATFQAWETFSTPTGPNDPQTVSGAGTGFFKGFGGDASATWVTINDHGMPNAFDSSPNAGDPTKVFITSGGNIYSPAFTTLPVVTIPNAGGATTGVTTILLQVRTAGTELNLNTVKLFDPVSGKQIDYNSRTELFRAPAGPGGFTVDNLFRFDVAGNAALYTLTFNATGSSSSLDRIAVDTNYNAAATAVPEPSSLLLAGLGGLAGGWWHRRRQSRKACDTAIGDNTTIEPAIA